MSSQRDSFRGVLDEAKYEYVAKLGAGAFGTVVKARHVPLDVPVAVKILHRGLDAETQAPERFRVEAQATALLSAHPNVPEILDYGITLDGRPFLTMRFLEGRTLEQELRERTALPPHEAVDITLQVLSALEAAHKVGVVHRDVKPANIFLVLGPNGARTVKLLDFGIAKVVQGNGTLKPKSHDTADGSILGSPRYFAPEQAHGRMSEIDARTDVYAVGGVLFHMLTGASPFEPPAADLPHNNLLRLMHAHILEPPPSLSRTGVAFPPELDAAIQTALAKAKDDRHPSAAAFAQALRGIDVVASAPSARGQGTEPIEHARLMQEVSKRQRLMEQEARGQRRTVRIDEQARAQELDRLRRESGWRGRGATEPSPSGKTPAPSVTLEGRARPHAPTRRRGWTRREAVVIAIICGLVVAASIIAIASRFGR